MKTTIAAFDFDKTLTTRDSFLPFSLFVVGFWRWIGMLVKLSPALLRYFVGMETRQSLKERILTDLFKGEPLSKLEEEAHAFAQELLPRFVKLKALKTVEWHLEQGHTVVLVSAAPSLYLVPYAKAVGIHRVLASELELDEEGKLTGRLKGVNCRGEEKVRRLKEAFGPKEGYTLYAYGDSKGDREMLDFADYPHYRKI